MTRLNGLPSHHLYQISILSVDFPTGLIAAISLLEIDHLSLLYSELLQRPYPREQWRVTVVEEDHGRMRGQVREVGH